MSSDRVSQVAVASPQPLSWSALRELGRDLVVLTKPRLIPLLLISTCCPMILAANGEFLLFPILWAMLGGALVTSSASAFNCIIERDTDALMERTKERPMPRGSLPVGPAVLYAVVLGVCGLTVFTVMLNPLAAILAMVGHLFYVVVYTVMLKKYTPQNIVIGGAAGAVPPLVGWAAVTGEVSLTAVLLFFVVFLWTPPHFWALALNKNEDYQRAGIPMLPVIAGERATHLQMFWYALVLVPVSLLVVASDARLGWFSATVMSLSAGIFAYKTYQLKRLGEQGKEERTAKAWDVFGFSLVYLGFFFLCLVIDSAFI